jgi:hypothetical protein
VRFGQPPNAEGLLYGVKPVIVANGDPQSASDHAAERVVRPSLPPPSPGPTVNTCIQRAKGVNRKQSLPGYSNRLVNQAKTPWAV